MLPIAKEKIPMAIKAAKQTMTVTSVTHDTQRHTLIINSDITELKVGETAVITFMFSEKVKGFTANDITVSGGTLSTPCCLRQHL